TRRSSGPFAQRPPRGRQPDVEPPLILFAAGAGDHPVLLQPLHQRRRRCGIQSECRSEFVQRSGRALPEREHHEVLRMSEPERLENGPIDRYDVSCGRDECEAQLVLELEHVIGRSHALDYSYTLIIRTQMIWENGTMENGPERPPLRTRIREAGGLYRWFNSNLIRL